MSARDSDLLRRARDYPYESPDQSFSYINGEIRPFNIDETRGRTPVLAFGSNKAPSQLQRKFGHLEACLIPVEMVSLHHFDVVFAAHITSYGAIPAMLQYCPNVIVHVGITWLDEVQLDIMHETELYAANYSYAQLKNVTITRDNVTSNQHEILDYIYAYVGERGHFPADSQGAAYAISAIQAQNRRWPSATCGDLLETVFSQYSDALNSDQFIRRLVEETPYRREISEKISQGEHKFSYQHLEKIQVK